MMNIIDHGKWLAYKPEQIDKKIPLNVMFAKRESDTVDWYEYVNSGENFGADSVKFMAIWQEDASGYVVGPAVLDPTMLFPAGQIVGEITNYTGTDPQSDFGNKVYDPATHTFYDMLPPPPPPSRDAEIMSALDTIMMRLEKLEKKG